MSHLSFTSRIACLVAICFLSACGVVSERDGPGRDMRSTQTQDAIPKQEPLSKYGNPDTYVVLGKRYHTLKTSRGFKETGTASWYGKKFHGRRTSSGETYDMYRMTAAHKHLPLPTYVEVKNLENGRRAIVKVNDRGPFHGNRIIDLSYAAATKLGFTTKGTAHVEIRAIHVDDSNAPRYAETPIMNPEQTIMALDISQAISKPLEVTQIPAVMAAIPTPLPALEEAVNPFVGYYLQIGSFRDRKNAVRLSDRVAPHIGHKTRIQEYAASGDRVYRVQIGPIPTIDSADEFVKRLLTIGIAEPQLILQ